MLDQDVAKAKFPTEWHFVDTLPTTASGKVQEQLLADRPGESDAGQNHDVTAGHDLDLKLVRAKI